MSMVSDPVATTDWRQLAPDTSIPKTLFIGGDRRPAIDGSSRAVNSPRDGSTLVKLAWQPADALETSAQWFPDDPLLPDTKMGPLVDEQSLQRVLQHLDSGLAKGASLKVGGHRVLAETDCTYLKPTVITGVAPDNPIACEEIFGPVLAVQVVQDEAEAVRVAGDTPYGLAAALWTSDLGTAHRVSRALRAGTVWVNCYEEGDMAVPFGGVKLSGFGRDKSRHALEEYTYLKTTWIRYD
jgi:4-(gamma-glutamylamino)butanal dehydrogenase